MYFILFKSVMTLYKQFYKIYSLLKNPRIAYITCDMSDISFPYLSDTVPFYAVGLYGVLGPLIVIVFVEIANARLYPFQNKYFLPPNELIRKFFIYLFHAISLFLFGISIVLLLTEIGKRWIGKLKKNSNIARFNK